MGWLGKLFGGGGRKVPSWALEAFGTDVDRFDAFVDVVGTVLEGGASADDIRTGSLVLEQREWILHEVARDCAASDAGRWRDIIERSFRGSADSDDDMDDEELVERIVADQEPSRPWVIGTAAWGGVMFECGDKAMLLVLLPIVDRGPFDNLPEFSPGLIEHIVVCNGGTAGHFAVAEIAKKAGLDHVYAIEPANVAGIEARAFDKLLVGPLRIERAAGAVFGRWNDGGTFLCGDAVPMSEIAKRMPQHVVGKIVVDEMGKSIDWMMKIKRALIVANVPGLDADRLAEMFSMLGVAGEIVNATTSRRMQVLALMIAGDLEAADKLATDAATGDEAADMQFQRAMIALMRGRDSDAEALLATIDTPQAVSSRAILAAQRKDPAARELAKQAVIRLPGDAIAISAAIQVHALAGDRDGARALLAEHGAHLEVEQRLIFDRMIDEPPEATAHRFPEHAKLAVDAVKPMLDAGRFAEAEPTLRRAHEWDPGAAEITAELGFALSQQQRDVEAIALYDEAIARGGSSTLLRFNRGNCHVRSERFIEAAKDFRACLDIKEDWHDARVNLVSALFASSDKDGAKRELAQLKKLGGNPKHVALLEEMLGS